MRNISPILFSGLPKGTKALLLISSAVFILEFFIKGYIIHYLGLIPLKVISSGWFWQIITYLFVHGGFWHFFFNMLMLWIFGKVIENALGTVEFLKYFFITGVGAAIITLLFSFNSPVPVVGASGAIYGLMIAFAVIYPDAKVYLYFLFPVTSKQMVAILTVMELAMSFSGSNPHVANVAHLGGMLVGYLYFKGLRNLKFSLRNLNFLKKTPVSREEEINRILDKISKKGINSLSGGEKDKLDEFSGHS